MIQNELQFSENYEIIHQNKYKIITILLRYIYDFMHDFDKVEKY